MIIYDMFRFWVLGIAEVCSLKFYVCISREEETRKKILELKNTVFVLQIRYLMLATVN